MTEPDRNALVTIEVAYAEPERQFLRSLQVPVGTTVDQGIAESGVSHEFSIDATALRAGLWSKAVARDKVLRDGDRVELYRPLKADPKEARRTRAERASGKRVNPAQP